MEDSGLMEHAPVIEKLDKNHLSAVMSHRRFDLIAKYLYARELTYADKRNDYKDTAIESLYARHILMRTKGREAIGKYSHNVIKQTIDDYVKYFKELVESMQQHGFQADFPIPVGDNGLLLDGAHRLSAARALDLDVYIQHCAEAGFLWDFNWFMDKGFSTEDKMRLLKGFVDLNIDNTVIFLIWHPAFAFLGNIHTLISGELDIVGAVDLDFEDNYIAFTNVLLDIYETNTLNRNKFATILRKAQLLQSDYLSFQVIVATNKERNSDSGISAIVVDLKDKIRELLDNVITKNIFATVHSSDGARECKHLADTLLSPNNIKHLKMRRNYLYSNKFLQTIEQCKRECEKNAIDYTKICIVGSAPMTVLGIQQNSDIDFVIEYSQRERFGDELVRLDGVDIARPDRKHNKATDINDDILINFDDYYFLFGGLKFANLHIIKGKKAQAKVEKSAVHVRQIELFERFTAYPVQQSIILKQGINNELERRILEQKQKKFEETQKDFLRRQSIYIEQQRVFTEQQRIFAEQQKDFFIRMIHRIAYRIKKIAKYIRVTMRGFLHPKKEQHQFERSQFIQTINEAVVLTKKNYLYFDWPLGGYIFKELGDFEQNEVNFIKFSPFELFGIKDRLQLNRFRKNNPKVVRKELQQIANGLKNIDGILFTFDWLKICHNTIDAFRKFNISSVLITHEGVFQNSDIFYNKQIPYTDKALLWGELHKDIFIKRGYPQKNIETIGSIKLAAYRNFQPILSRDEFFGRLGLNSILKTVLYCCQLYDVQYGNQDMALQKQLEVINDIIMITQKYKFNCIIRNAPAMPQKIISMKFIDAFRQCDNVVFDGNDLYNLRYSTYRVEAGDSMYFSDIVCGANTTMQLEAGMLHKPSFIVKYFEFDPKWNKELGLPIANNRDELEQIIVDNIELQHNLFDPGKTSDFCRDYGVGFGEDFNPRRAAIKFLSNYATGKTK